MKTSPDPTVATPHDAPAIVVHELAVCGAEGPLEARVYKVGVDSLRDHLIVFFHGGGFIDGDLDGADGFLRQWARACGSAVILSSSYTLATIKPFPSAIEDAYAVLLWARKHKDKLGWTGKRLLVAGIEAGANLAAASAHMARDRIRPTLAGQILLMPMLDPSMSSASMRKMPDNEGQLRRVSECAAAYGGYLKHVVDRVHPYAAPGQSSRLKNLPPALILSMEGDPLRDEAEAYGAQLIDAGVRTTVSRLRHARVQSVSQFNECACMGDVLAEIAGFVAALDEHLAPSAVFSSRELALAEIGSSPAAPS